MLKQIQNVTHLSCELYYSYEIDINQKLSKFNQILVILNIILKLSPVQLSSGLRISLIQQMNGYNSFIC